MTLRSRWPTSKRPRNILRDIQDTLCQGNQCPMRQGNHPCQGNRQCQQLLDNHSSNSNGIPQPSNLNCWEIASKVLKAPHLRQEAHQQWQRLRNNYKLIRVQVCGKRHLSDAVRDSEGVVKQRDEILVVLCTRLPNNVKWVGRTDPDLAIIYMNLNFNKYEVTRIIHSFKHELLHLLPENQGEPFSEPKSWEHLKLHGKALCS